VKTLYAFRLAAAYFDDCTIKGSIMCKTVLSMKAWQIPVRGMSLLKGLTMYDRRRLAQSSSTIARDGIVRN
jgi:hypothetical protein